MKPRATKVLVIGYVWPEPRSSAAGGHMIQILETFLTQGWDITFSSPAALGEHKADLLSLGIAECAIELNNSSFDDFIRELAPDIVLFDRFMMEEQFGWRVEKHCPDALRVLETSDLQSLRDARHQRLKDHVKAHPGSDDFGTLFAPALEQEFQLMAETDLAKREIAAIYRCDISLMISDVEIRLLTEQFKVPAALLHWCPLMMVPPTTAFAPYEDRAHFLSIGNFRHAPNWDAVLWMKSSLWPLIRQQLPGAQLHVYGAYTPPKATALHNPAQGFHVMNWAEDALQVMTAARICLAPCALVPASRASWRTRCCVARPTSPHRLAPKPWAMHSHGRAQSNRVPLPWRRLRWPCTRIANAGTRPRNTGATCLPDATTSRPTARPCWRAWSTAGATLPPIDVPTSPAACCATMPIKVPSTCHSGSKPKTAPSEHRGWQGRPQGGIIRGATNNKATAA